jgi:hypothetical protein
MSDQENRNSQHSDPQKPAPPEQKPVIQGSNTGHIEHGRLLWRG